MNRSIRSLFVGRFLCSTLIFLTHALLATPTVFAADDTTPPAPPIFDIQPGQVSNAINPLFTWHGEDGATYQCKQDEETYSICGPDIAWPYQAIGLAGGQHEFSVKQYDAAGNSSESSVATYSWLIDLTGPALILTSNLITNSEYPEVSGTISDAAFVQIKATKNAEVAVYRVSNPSGSWSINLGETLPISGSLDFSQDGNFDINVTAEDEVGNAAISISYNLVIDRTRPEAPVITQISDSSRDLASVEFEVTNEPGGRFECKIDNGVFESCESPITYFDLPDGPHTSTVRFIDEAGNVSSPAQMSWQVLTPAISPPTITSAIPNPYATSVRFTFTGSADSMFACKLDDGPLIFPCTSPWITPNSLAVGSHTFKVRQANNVESSRDRVFTWLVKEKLTQTINIPAKIKKSKSISLPIKTNAKLGVTLKASGSCKAAYTYKNTKIKEGKRIVNTKVLTGVKLTAGKKQGICRITAINSGNVSYKALNRTVQILVTN